MGKSDNLRPPWPKGVSGNPKGRPRKLPGLQQLMAEVLGEFKEDMTAAEAILKKMRAKATQGDIRAAEFLFAYAYGKAKQNLEINENGVTIKVVRDGGSYKPKGIAPGSADSSGAS